MKTLKLGYWAVILGSLWMLTACGSSNTTSSGLVSCATGYTYNSTSGSCVYTGTTTTSCSSGYVYSNIYSSCLQQTTSCEGSYAIYNGSCVQYYSSAIASSTSCASGYVYSSTYGSCLQQTTSCSGSYALYNGSCVLYSSTTTTTTSSYQGSCSAGFVHTAAGCLQQGVCTTGYGFGYYYGTPWCYPYTSG